MSDYEFPAYGYRDENKKSIEELKAEGRAQDYPGNYNQQYAGNRNENAARQMYSNPNPTLGMAYGAQASYSHGGAPAAQGTLMQQPQTQGGVYPSAPSVYGARQAYSSPASAKKRGRGVLAVIMALVCVLAGLGGTLLGGMIVENKYASSIKGYEQLVSQLQTQSAANPSGGNPDGSDIIAPDDGKDGKDTGDQGGIIEPDSVIDTGGRQGLSIKDIAKLVGPSVVSIYADVDSGGYYQGTSAGSGIIITEDGTIVTNHHVIDGATNIKIVLSDGTEYEARVLASDANEDVAVLKADATGLTAATLGNSSELEVGDTAVVIGNPLGEMEGTVTAGIISALEREVRFEDGTTRNLMQTDAAINRGNSGGALINAYGEIIGIVNAKNEGVGVEGLAFAIPIDRAKGIITDLLDKGYVTGRPQLGVTIYRPSPTSLPGAVVAATIPGGAAEKAGVEAEDRIIMLGGDEVTDFETLELAKNKHKPGDTLDMVVVRDEEEITLSITLGEWIQ